MQESNKQYILTISARAHSVKYTYFEYDSLAPVYSGRFEHIDLPGTLQLKDGAVYVLGNNLSYLDCIKYLLTSEHNIPKEQLAGIGHRIVHGGTRFNYPVLIDNDVRAYLKSIIHLAPSHLPQNIAAINVCNYVLKEEVPQVGVFDTEFHSNIAEHYTRLPIPYKYHEQGIRRYGFHGIAYESIVQQMKTLNPMLHEKGKYVACYLGNGSSACAIEGGNSKATTMGYSSMSGIMMGLRPGDLDPQVVLEMLVDHGMDPYLLEQTLYKKCGLKAVSDLTHDVRDLADSSSQNATLALTMYATSVAESISKLACAINGLDALVFTGGLGGNADFIRAMVIDKLKWMNFDIDAVKNYNNETVISKNGKPIYVLNSQQDLMLAEHTKNIVSLFHIYKN